MKFSVIASVVASAALVAAQLDQIPQCALSCAISSIGASGCSPTDIACVCGASAFLSSITTCVQGACSPAELQQTFQAAAGLCASVGVTITIPGSTPSTTSAAEPSTTSAAPVTSTSTVVVPTSTSTVEVPSTSTAVYVPTSSTSAAVSTSSKSTKTMTYYTTICPSSTLTTTHAPVYTPTYVPPTGGNATYTTAPPMYTGGAGSVAANAGSVLVGAALAMFFA